ncbi:MAG: hypothetical protein AB8F26_08820 [Phycisphaerales bacterium]
MNGKEGFANDPAHAVFGNLPVGSPRAQVKQPFNTCFLLQSETIVQPIT